jgi:hypothetical protein
LVVLLPLLTFLLATVDSIADFSFFATFFATMSVPGIGNIETGSGD